MSESLIFAHFLFFGERCGWIASFAQIKCSSHSEEMSVSLILLTKNERMSESFIFFERIAHSLIFGQKTRDSLGNRMSDFPALLHGLVQCFAAHLVIMVRRFFMDSSSALLLTLWSWSSASSWTRPVPAAAGQSPWWVAPSAPPAAPLGRTWPRS